MWCKEQHNAYVFTNEIAENALVAAGGGNRRSASVGIFVRLRRGQCGFRRATGEEGVLLLRFRAAMRLLRRFGP